MKRMIRLIFLAALTISVMGCAHDPFNIPRADYEQRVRVLGVAPIFMDADSDIRHPERDTLVTLVREYNRKNEKELVEMIKDTGAYFSVRFLDAASPDDLYRTLLYRAERRDDAGVVYNKHFYRPEEIRTLVTRNGVDAVLLVVVSGLTRRDRVFSSNLVKYLDADYNILTMSAQVLDATGTTLWEYPNFRAGGPSTPVLAELQYPDFDEAAANMDDRVDVKFKTIPGLTRHLGKREKDIFFRERRATAPYHRLFSDMVGLLKPPIRLFGEERAGTSPISTPAPYHQPQPVTQTPSQLTPSPSVPPATAPAAKPDTLVVPEPTPVRELPLDTKPLQ